ncbi:hypothetical protein BD310DRAFT_940765 [Dichomitus squalens]|uniref:Uncharacterized protein n=1 Tax=Dichomitus squalens TaxID=114155 RepID=A0A4Q9PBT8_9APHY|nr:hypothetical protein BD310DRAFT_940765 [Dichomitus squalens]
MVQSLAHGLVINRHHTMTKRTSSSLANYDAQEVSLLTILRKKIGLSNCIVIWRLMMFP